MKLIYSSCNISIITSNNYEYIVIFFRTRHTYYVNNYGERWVWLVKYKL